MEITTKSVNSERLSPETVTSIIFKHFYSPIVIHTVSSYFLMNLLVRRLK